MAFEDDSDQENRRYSSKRRSPSTERRSMDSSRDEGSRSEKRKFDRPERRRSSHSTDADDVKRESSSKSLSQKSLRASRHRSVEKERERSSRQRDSTREDSREGRSRRHKRRDSLGHSGKSTDVKSERDRSGHRSSSRAEAAAAESGRRRRRSRSVRRSRHSSRSKDRSKGRSRDRSRREDERRRSSSRDRSRRRDRKSYRSRTKSPPPAKPAKKSKWDMAVATDLGPGLGGFAGYGAGLLPPLEDRRGRRLYVGNLPPGISETAIVQFFNGALLAAAGVDYAVAAASGQFPALKAEVGPRRIDASGQYLPDHRYCFVEFRTIADASICLKLDGLSFNGFTLKIGRPNDYTHIPKAQEMSTTEALAAGSVVSALARMIPETKLYVTDLPLTVTDNDLRRMTEAYGVVRSAALMKDLRTGQSMGCGIVEFEDPASTEAAVKALDNRVMGGKLPRFTKGPLVPPAVSKLLEPAAAITGPTSTIVTELPTSMTHKVLSSAIIGAQVQAARRDGSTPSTVVQLLNAVFPEDLVSYWPKKNFYQIKDEDYNSIMEEMRRESSEFGTVLEIVILRPPPDLSFKPGVGKVFIHYADITAARKAQAELNGRRYEERRVICAAFYPLDLFKEKKYTIIQ